MQQALGRLVGSALVAASLLLTPAAPAAQHADAPIRLRIVGGLGKLTSSRVTSAVLEARTRAPERWPATADIVAFDQTGLNGSEMLRLIQIGAVPFATALLPLSRRRTPNSARLTWPD